MKLKAGVASLLDDHVEFLRWPAPPLRMGMRHCALLDPIHLQQQQQQQQQQRRTEEQLLPLVPQREASAFRRGAARQQARASSVLSSKLAFSHAASSELPFLFSSANNSATMTHPVVATLTSDPEKHVNVTTKHHHHDNNNNNNSSALSQHPFHDGDENEPPAILDYDSEQDLPIATSITRSIASTTTTTTTTSCVAASVFSRSSSVSLALLSKRMKRKLQSSTMVMANDGQRNATSQVRINRFQEKAERRIWKTATATTTTDQTTTDPILQFNDEADIELCETDHLPPLHSPDDDASSKKKQMMNYQVMMTGSESDLMIGLTGDDHFEHKSVRDILIDAASRLRKRVIIVNTIDCNKILLQDSVPLVACNSADGARVFSTNSSTTTTTTITTLKEEDLATTTTTTKEETAPPMLFDDEDDSDELMMMLTSRKSIHDTTTPSRLQTVSCSPLRQNTGCLRYISNNTNSSTKQKFKTAEPAIRQVSSADSAKSYFASAFFSSASRLAAFFSEHFDQISKSNNSSISNNKTVLLRAFPRFNTAMDAVAREVWNQHNNHKQAAATTSTCLKVLQTLKQQHRQPHLSTSTMHALTSPFVDLLLDRYRRQHTVKPRALINAEENCPSGSWLVCSSSPSSSFSQRALQEFHRRDGAIHLATNTSILALLSSAATNDTDDDVLVSFPRRHGNKNSNEMSTTLMAPKESPIAQPFSDLLRSATCLNSSSSLCAVAAQCVLHAARFASSIMAAANEKNNDNNCSRNRNNAELPLAFFFPAADETAEQQSLRVSSTAADLFKLTALWAGTFASTLFRNRQQQQQQQQQVWLVGADEESCFALVGSLLVLEQRGVLPRGLLLASPSCPPAATSCSIRVLLREEIVMTQRNEEGADDADNDDMSATGTRNSGGGGSGTGVAAPSVIILAPSGFAPSLQSHANNMNKNNDSGDEEEEAEDEMVTAKMLCRCIRSRWGASVTIIPLFGTATIAMTDTSDDLSNNINLFGDERVIVYDDRFCDSGEESSASCCCWCREEASQRVSTGIDIELLSSSPPLSSSNSQLQDAQSDQTRVFQTVLLPKSRNDQANNSDCSNSHNRAFLQRVDIELDEWWKDQQQEAIREHGITGASAAGGGGVHLPSRIVVRSLVPFVVDNHVLFENLRGRGERAGSRAAAGAAADRYATQVRVCVLIDVEEDGGNGIDDTNNHGDDTQATGHRSAVAGNSQLHRQWIHPLREQLQSYDYHGDGRDDDDDDDDQHKSIPVVNISVKSVKGVLDELGRVATAALLHQQQQQQHPAVSINKSNRSLNSASAHQGKDEDDEKEQHHTKLSLFFVLVSTGTAASSARVLSALASSCASFIDFASRQQQHQQLPRPTVSTALVLIPPMRVES